MIIDTAANAALYRGVHVGVDRALGLLESVPWGKLEDGRHELAEGVFALLSSYSTGLSAATRYEAHRLYADVQLVVQGRETIFWAPAAELEVEEDYDPEADILFFQEPEPDQTAITPLAVRSGMFVLLYPADAHKPGRLWGAAAPVRKAVLKVRL